MSLGLHLPLWHPNVASVMLGAISRKDLDKVLSALRSGTDIERFKKVVRLLQNKRSATVEKAEA
jgi:hypothetical protein